MFGQRKLRALSKFLNLLHIDKRLSPLFLLPNAIAPFRALSKQSNSFQLRAKS